MESESVRNDIYALNISVLSIGGLCYSAVLRLKQGPYQSSLPGRYTKTKLLSKRNQWFFPPVPFLPICKKISPTKTVGDERHKRVPYKYDYISSGEKNLL